MITETSRWSASCDKCRKTFEVMGRTHVTAYRWSLEADLKRYEWTYDGFKCYCPDCKKRRVK